MNIIQPEELERILLIRDIGIDRVEIATQTRKKQLKTNNTVEYESIPIPRIYPFNLENVFLDRNNIAESHFFYTSEDAMLDMYCKGYTLNINGYVVSKYGNLGAVAVTDLYRGEIRDYGTQCNSTLGRLIKDNSFENCLAVFAIGQMRILCFAGFLMYFKQFTDFKIGTPMAHVIAQHYGLNTQFLDLTDDVKVALFFACCKHISNNKYRPISTNDIQELGEFGVLYHGLENDYTQIIGYQPFTRCYKQRGYYFDTAATKPCWNFSLTDDTGFTKSYFKRTPELSKRIFEEFDGGNRLFPKDSLFYFEQEINEIATTKTFPETIFEKAYDIILAHLEIYKRNNIIKKEDVVLFTKDWLKEKITTYGISIKKKFKLSAENTKMMEVINNNWDPVEYAKDEGIIAWSRKIIPTNEGFYMSVGPGGIDMLYDG